MIQNNRIKNVLVSIMFLLFAVTVNGEEKKITIFHINDLHAKINNLAKMDAVVDKERAINKRTFLFNAGDNFSGNPYVDQADPKGEPVLQIFNKMGFDAYVIGNHEFDYDQKILSGFMKRAAFPFVCANFKVKSKGIPQPPPFVIVEKGGVRIGVIGMIQIEESNGLPSTLPSKVRNISFTRADLMIDKFKHLKEKCDLVIVLSHLGFESDKILARKAGWVDMIIGGHSHTTLKKPHMENGVIIVQAGAHGKFIGRVDLTVKDNKVVTDSGKLIKLSAISEESGDIKKLIDKFNSNPVLMQKLADLPEAVEGKEALGSMVSDIIREKYNLDMVFYNSGGIRIKKIGPVVRLKDVYAMHPFGNYVVKLNMSYDEVAGLIKSDFDRHKDVDFLISGFRYTVNVKEDGTFGSVDMFDLKGRKIEKDNSKRYKVGITNYVLTSTKFRHEDPGKSTYEIVAEIVKSGIGKVKNPAQYQNISRTGKKFTGGAPVAGRNLPVALAGNQSFRESSSAGNFAADALRVVNKTDFAFYPSRLIKRGYIVPKGSTLKSSQLKEMYKYCDRNRAVIVEMKGKDIREFLLKRFSFRHKVDVQVSGMSYDLRVNSGNHTVVISIKIENGTFDENKIYRVAFNDYDFDKYYNLDGIAQKVKRSKISVMDIFTDYFSKHELDKRILKERRITVKKGA